MNVTAYHAILRRLGVDPEPARPGLALAVEYRATLRQGFALIAAGPDPAPAQCAEFLAEQARLETALGPELAAEIGRDEARAWHRDTGRCLWCGEFGSLHAEEGTVASEESGP
jgi:hypothetical protein